MKSKLHNPKRQKDSNSKTPRRGGAAGRWTKGYSGSWPRSGPRLELRGLTTLEIKDMEITIVPMVVIQNIVVMAHMMRLSVAVGTTDGDSEMQLLCPGEHVQPSILPVTSS